MVYTIKLNGDFINSIRHTIEFLSLHKTKVMRERLKFAHCLFLTQDKNVLTYQSVTPTKIVQISTLTDSTLPYPLAINLEPVYWHDCHNVGLVDLEIPDCTFTTLQCFHDANRPKYIKSSDLKTSVVKIGDKKTNLEYMDNIEFYTSYLQTLIDKKLKFASIDNAKQCKWATSDLYDLSYSLYVCDSHNMRKQGEYTYQNLYTPPTIRFDEFEQEIANKISKFGYLDKTVFDENTYENKIQTLPIAIFEKSVKDTKVTALLVASSNTK